MRNLFFVAASLCALVLAGTASAGTWTSSVPFTNQVASSPTTGGGYPIPPGQTVPDAGTCRAGPFNANHSESWIAVKPGTEDLVGTSKFFFDKFSTFYMFYLGSYRLLNGAPVDNKQIEGYDCVSRGTQDMPPSWTDTTDPNADFDTRGRVFQVMLPFNAYWDGTKLHPDGAIDVVYSDDMGQHWTIGNGGQHLENSGNPSAKQLGHVEDKQWVAVNHISGNLNQDHVYAAWAIYNGNSTAKIRLAVSRDHGQTFTRAATISDPNQTGPLNEYVYPAVDAAGNVYVSIVSSGTIYVARSVNDGQSFGPFIAVAPVGIISTCCLPNTTFRDGIAEHFVASQTRPGHLYLAYEDWDGSQFDVKFTYSTDGGFTWSTPQRVNDNTDYLANDQFQPEVATAGDSVAVAFYDRRQACPNDPSIRPQDVGRTNFCIDTSLQAFHDSGTTLQRVGNNVRISDFTWDPEQPDQTIDGIDQMACAGHSNPCTRVAFIGDYFGLAMSGGNVYALMVSTHYRSNVRGDGNRWIYYQQQVLAKVPRAGFGGGF